MFLLISLHIQSKMGTVVLRTGPVACPWSGPLLAALARALLGRILPATECSQLAAYLLLL